MVFFTFHGRLFDPGGKVKIMPTAILQTIEKWKRTAADQIEDIRDWRDSTDQRPCYDGPSSRGWGDPPEHFHSQTIWIVSHIATHHRNLDPGPVQDINEVVTAWHTDHNASRIPEQPVLDALIDRAVTVVQAVEAAVDVLDPSGNSAEHADKKVDPDAEPDARYSAAELSKRYGRPLETLRKQLESWRKQHDDGWNEIPPSERKPRGPKFLYRVGAVREFLVDG